MKFPSLESVVIDVVPSYWGEAVLHRTLPSKCSQRWNLSPVHLRIWPLSLNQNGRKNEGKYLWNFLYQVRKKFGPAPCYYAHFAVQVSLIKTCCTINKQVSNEVFRTTEERAVLPIPSPSVRRVFFEPKIFSTTYLWPRRMTRPRLSKSKSNLRILRDFWTCTNCRSFLKAPSQHKFQPQEKVFETFWYKTSTFLTPGSALKWLLNMGLVDLKSRDKSHPFGSYLLWQIAL